MSRARQMYCVFLALVSLTALLMTWSQNLLYFTGANPAGFGQYLLDLKATGAARSFTVRVVRTGEHEWPSTRRPSVRTRRSARRVR